MSTLFTLLSAAAFAFLGSFIAYHGARYYFGVLRLFWTCLPSNGVVTGMKPDFRSRKGRTWIEYTAVISFETAWHEKRTVEYAGAFGNTRFNIGDKVNIWYHKTDQELFTLGGRHFAKDVLSFLVFALGFGLPGWTLLLTTLKTLFYE